MRAELEKIGAPADLVQVLPSPVDKPLTNALMAACDLVVVTGSQNNVRNAYRSGTPAIGVGVGQRSGHHRFEREARRSGGEDPQFEVLRQRDVVLVGELGHHRRRRLRRRHRRTGTCRRLLGRCGGEGRDPQHALGERKAQPQGHRERLRRVRGGVRTRWEGTRVEILHGRRDRGRQRLPVLGREARAGPHRIPREDVRRRRRQGPRNHGVQGEGPLRRHPHRGRSHTPGGSPRSSIPRGCW